MRNDDPAPSKVLILDRQALARERIRAALSGEPDLRVVGEARDGREALELCRDLRPDIALVGLTQPDAVEMEAARALKEECPGTRVLLLATRESEDLLLEAVRLGAAGYVLKGSTPAQLLNAAQKTLEGMSPFNREVAMRLLKRLEGENRREQQTKFLPVGRTPARSERAARGTLLTPRELDVLPYLVKGNTNHQIAQELHVSISTVKKHLEHIISKLEVSDRTQAAVKAAELGLVRGTRDRGSSSGHS
ncbi:response regulator [Rubrobacter tropicus]|uniref:Response regulator n=1 Tax=Rubrobacter tropicus TaxID=2653851 RepID=A0A6G8QD02_9ACTN|nr:response regulator transcription factor [Rubrobacter tropicus]QIN84366.1 response regulator [Rubrobacter tropicus]